MDIQKLTKGPPFTFFGTMTLIGDQKKIQKKNQKNFRDFFQIFPSCGYCNLLMQLVRTNFVLLC